MTADRHAGASSQTRRNDASGHRGGLKGSTQHFSDRVPSGRRLLSPASRSVWREHLQRPLQVPLQHLFAEESHRDTEEPAPALPAPVKDHANVTADAVARLDGQCPCPTGLPYIRILGCAHDTVVRPFVPLAGPHSGAPLGGLSPVRALVVQLPEIARDVRPQVRSSLGEVGCRLHHQLGWNVGVYNDDDMRHDLTVPPLSVHHSCP